MVAKAGGMDNTEFTGRGDRVRLPSRTSFDASPTTDDVNLQSISMTNVRGIYSLPYDISIMGTYGASLDRSNVRGAFPAIYNTRSLQGSLQLEKKLKVGRVFAGMDHEIQG